MSRNFLLKSIAICFWLLPLLMAAQSKHAVTNEEYFKNTKFIPSDPNAKPLSYNDLSDEQKRRIGQPFPISKRLPPDWSKLKDDTKFTYTFDGVAFQAVDLDKYIPKAVHLEFEPRLKGEAVTKVRLYSEKGFTASFPNGFRTPPDRIDLSGYESKEPPSAYAKFPGGIEAFVKFLGSNLHVPNDLESSQRVMVRFFVETDGTIHDFKIVTQYEGISWLKPELERVFSLSPKWTFDPKAGPPKRTEQTIPIMLMGKE